MSSGTDVLSGLFAGRYAIEREVGRGATSVVYRARDQQTGRTVALKILREILLESRSAGQFLREIEHHQGLTHPHIVPVLDSGDADGRPYIVHPYLDGGTLRTRLQRERQLPFREAISIATALADALAHAHRAGLVHRDVKPENILFENGQAFLSDFGIARALERATGEVTTTTGVIRGTPAYVSPEQASGLIEYDGRSDVYSLGCVLYEMVGGVQPFLGPTPQSVIAQRLSFRPTPVAQFRDTVPPDLEVIIERAMMTSPADRYQSAGEMLGALQSAGTDPSDPVRRAASRRKGRVFVMAGAAFAVTAAAVAYALWPEAGTIPENDPRRIAVLYMNTLTPDSLPEHIADGISEDLIDRLSGVTALHITSPDGVRPFKNDTLPIDSIQKVLKVGTIVSGSVARSGDRVRVDVRFTDAVAGRQVASATVEEPWAELFALQEGLAERVQQWTRENLGYEISVLENRAATKSVVAWEQVQLAIRETRRAIQAASVRGDTSSTRLFLRADSLYVQASSIDPGWILPIVKRGNLALLALAARSPISPNVADSARYQSMSPPERSRLWVERARALAREALSRSPRDPEALALFGRADLALAATDTLRRDTLLAGAEANLRTALTLRPNEASTWTSLAELLLQRGRFAEAADAAQHAIDADAYYEVRRVLAVALSASLSAERFDDAQRWCRQGLTYYPGDIRFIECSLRIMGSTGRTRAAARDAWAEVARIEAADTIGRLEATWGYRRLMVAAILARAGQRDSARAVVSHVARQQPASARAASPPAEAYVLLLLKDEEAAVRVLGDYLRALPPGRATPILMQPWFADVRNDPRLDSLAR